MELSLSTSDVTCARPAGLTARAETLGQVLVLTVLCASPALLSVHVGAVWDSDIWWHLRAGEWIAQHHAVPRSDPFSSFGPNKPWVDYSWLFDLLVYGLFGRFGLLGLVAYTAGALVAITAAVFSMVRRLQDDFLLSALLTLLACLAMQGLYTPRPWLLSILCFVLLLHALVEARRSGQTRVLFALPLLFAFWANIHIQFVDGLLVLGLAGVEAGLQSLPPGLAGWLLPKALLRRSAQDHNRDLPNQDLPNRIALGMWLLALLLCTLAPLLNPYGWHIYPTAWDLATQPGVIDRISELHAPAFRDSQDFLTLFLSLGATAALSHRWRCFEALLLVFAIVLGFRSQRDVWLIACAAAVILASGLSFGQRTPRRLVPAATAWALGVASLLVLAVTALPFRRQRLEDTLSRSFPVGALTFLKSVPHRQPLYNTYDWGGFLIWNLREPVSLDGRASFYGTERLDRFNATWNGTPDWQNDPELRNAGVVIGPVKAPLVQLLRTDPAFQLVFEDQISVVFLGRPI